MGCGILSAAAVGVLGRVVLFGFLWSGDVVGEELFMSVLRACFALVGVM